MLTMRRLERASSAGRFDQLLSDVLANGRSLPLAARLRLSESDGLPAAALGMAIRRLCEIARRPTPAVVQMADALLDRQHENGGFGAIAATAAAVGGLLTLQSHDGAWPGAIGPELACRIELAIDRAMHHLFAAQSRGSGVEETPGLLGDAMDSALVLWQLADEPRAAAALRLNALERAIQEAIRPAGARDESVRQVADLARAGRCESLPVAA